MAAASAARAARAARAPAAGRRAAPRGAFGARRARAAATDAGAEAVSEGEARTALVLGAAGGVGREAVKALRASGWRVRAAVRTDAKRGDVPLVGADGDVEAVVVDVTKYETLPPALAGVDAIVVAVGTTDFTDPLGPYKNEYVGTKNVVAAARNAAAPGAGPKVVLVTSIGTEDPFFNPLNLAWGILFWKQRAEEELQRSGLRYTIVRPGGLSNDAVPGAAVLKPRGEARTGRVSRAEVARVCVEAIDLPEAEGKVVELVQDEGAAEAEMAVQFAAI